LLRPGCRNSGNRREATRQGVERINERPEICRLRDDLLQFDFGWIHRWLCLADVHPSGKRGKLMWSKRGALPPPGKIVAGAGNQPAGKRRLHDLGFLSWTFVMASA
jgi:hypothetical protein